MKLQSDNKMPLIKRERNSVLICFNEREITIDDVVKYEYDAVRTSFPYTYSSIVSAIITDKYPNDVMQAIVNNHLEGDSEEHEQEYLEMQQWRHTAKDVARQITTFGVE